MSRERRIEASDRFATRGEHSPGPHFHAPRFSVTELSRLTVNCRSDGKAKD
jgi:hypothetical protein